MCADLGAIGHFDVTHETALACNHTILADMRGSAHARLGCHGGVLPHFGVVRQHDEVVELHTLVDARRAHSGTVDGGIGTDFHIVLNDHITHLRDLLVMAVRLRCEAETISPDDHAGMKDTIVANHRVTVKFHAWIKYRIVTHNAVVAHIHLRINLHIVANLGILAHEGKLAEIDILATMCR